MPLPFSIICDLLEACHNLCIERKTYSSTVARWFARHRGRIDAHDTNLVALLSTLLPETRSDRVYCIQALTLERIAGRGLCLGTSRIQELSRHRQPGSGVDLADCVQRILSVTPNPISPESRVSVEEIDELLNAVASRIKWSSPAIRASQAGLTLRDRSDLEDVYRRFDAIEAKWFTRLVLKTYEPIIFDSELILRFCHPLLPLVIKIREDFTAAVNFLQLNRITLLPNSSCDGLRRDNLLAKVSPQTGIKVGRQNWLKARSIKHCLDLGSGRMSVEQKIDGEYCQIHVDLSKGSNWIQIFSKSGKDSTEDREGLHSVIKKSLRIGKSDCGFAKTCILEGELVVYSDSEARIMPFHKIRNHVKRRGRFLNTDFDSLPTDYEHLMIVYYDILLLDNKSLLDVRHSERFKILEHLIRQDTGWAEIVQRQIIDFGQHLAASNLRKVFADTIVKKREGLVLKPDRPYFNFSDLKEPTAGRCIKLKRDYIGNFGEIGDFAVVGAGYDSAKARSYKIPNLQWTHFYVGCLDNKEAVKRRAAVPKFTVVNLVELNETMLKTFIRFSNPLPSSRTENKETELTIAPGIERTPPLTVAFKNPPVFDLRCFSFDKVGNTGFWSPRFPSVVKIHFDRDFTDCVSFEELQTQAKMASDETPPEDSQENLEWIAKLEAADPRGIPVDAISQSTVSSGPSQSRQSSGSCPDTNAPISPSRTRTMPCIHELEETTPALMTPPASSNPVAPSSDRKSRKRSTDSGLSSSASSPATKKRKQSRNSANKSQLRDEPLSQPRKPLGAIIPNSSQSSTASIFTEVKSFYHGVEVVDLTDSPIKAELDPPQQENVLPLEDDQAIIISDNEDEPLEANADVPFLEEQTAPKVANGGICCELARRDCQFARTTILATSNLIGTTQLLQRQLEVHGLSEAIIDVKVWLADNRSGRLPPPSDKTILLVDSLNNEDEMRSTLKEVEFTRKRLFSNNRNWVNVYDWRVLEYISIMEDDTVTRKYYHGFNDPWSRWFCGLV